MNEDSRLTNRSSTISFGSYGRTPYYQEQQYMIGYGDYPESTHYGNRNNYGNQYNGYGGMGGYRNWPGQNGLGGGQYSGGAYNWRGFGQGKGGYGDYNQQRYGTKYWWPMDLKMEDIAYLYTDVCRSRNPMPGPVNYRCLQSTKNITTMLDT